jgi:hypothetical protein
VSFADLPTTWDSEEVYDPNEELARADTGFTGPDIQTDQDAIAETVFNRLAALVDNWQAHDGNPDVWLVEAFAAIGAEIRTLAVNVPDAIFITFGSEVLGMPIRPPAPATAFTRWTAENDRGYEVAPGLQLVVPRTGDDLVGFEVISGATILPGATMVEGVEVVAVANGAHANGLAGDAEMTDPLDWVQRVELTTTSDGGDDGQDRTEYLNNLSNLLRILAFRPVLPADFSILAMQVPGVGRAVAMDGYNPNTDTWGNARTITVVLADPDGEPLTQAVMDQVRESLERAREVNFLVFTRAPNYDTVNVEFTARAFAEQDPELVRDLAIDAVRQLLNPARYRLGVTSPGIEAGEVILPPLTGYDPGRQTIRINDIIGRLDRVRGVDWVGSVTINGAAQDLVLSSPITLPRVGEVEGTVDVPGTPELQ